MAEALRKLALDGSLYTRPPNIEASIDALSELSREELVKRSAIINRQKSKYVPSECLLYFVRQSRSDSSDQLFQDLYRLLRQRVLQVLPNPEHYASFGEVPTVQSTQLVLRDAVLDRFNQLLCIDRSGYEERLDFYEIRFAKAVAKLRDTAWKTILRNEARTEPLPFDDVTEVKTKDVSDALVRLGSLSIPGNDKSDYRSRLMTAIDTLPDDQRRIIEMLLLEIPIDSKDQDSVTIKKVLGCTEKTVRNRRDRAFATLKELLRKELTL